MSARCLANSELLTCYLVPSSCIEPFLDNTEYTTNSNNMLPSCISVNLKSSTISQLITIQDSQMIGFTVPVKQQTYSKAIK